MTSWTLIWRSLRFHARAHVGALLGAAIGSAVLVGALIVGDSVRGSLREMALLRLGKVGYAVASGDRLFREQLANDFASVHRAETAPLLLLNGTAANSDGSARANRVQVLGVNAGFWKLAAAAPAFGEVPNDGVVLNEELASKLSVRNGDVVLLRVPKHSQLSRDAPLSPEEDASVALRLTVHGVVTGEQFGRFSLQANQLPPLNAFVPLATLQQRIEATNRANALLSAGKSSTDKAAFSAGQRQTDSEASALLEANASLRKVWTLADAELELREVYGRQVELRSRRVFLDPAVTQVALTLTNAFGQTNRTGVLTYLVNELRVGDRATPYSMVTAMDNPGLLVGWSAIARRIIPRLGSPQQRGQVVTEMLQGLSPQVKADEILINQWLANDLQAKPGDTLEIKYYVIGQARRLEERSARFKVRDVLPMENYAADRNFMPDFPGITDAENCRDWDAGIPIKTEQIRDQDEKYWDEFRGTPKAFVTLAAGQQMWANRFGNLTAVRYPAEDNASSGTNDFASRAARIERQLLDNLNPAAVGLSFQPVRDQALKASKQGQDFGQLFLGFSFFLIGAALLLMALLFQFGVEQRATEIGTLLALGFRPKHVRRMLVAEGIVLSILGAVIGVLGGMLYAKGLLLGLGSIWQKAISGSALRFYAEPVTLAIGAVASTVVAVLVIWIALRRQAQQPARELLAEGGAVEDGGERREALDLPGDLRPARPGRRGWSGWLALAAGVGALSIVGLALSTSRTSDAGLFFSAGGLLLIAGCACSAATLRALLRRVSDLPSINGLAVRNAARRRRRSLAVIALLACGSFLIASIGVFRLDANADATKRSSGTGGFTYIGESSLPIHHDLNSEAGREQYGLSSNEVAGVHFVQVRVREGDDASCLNLNRAQRPRLLAVDAAELDRLQAFSFAGFAKGFERERPWSLLKEKLANGEIPAIGDAASIQWALGKKLGETIDYVDERGDIVKLRLVAGLANSILQGSLIIDQAHFISLFPNENGYRMFLIDAASKDTIGPTLTRALQDVGFELTPTTQRLAAFNAVQNTYLNTFQVLGGFGLLLGSAGLGVVVLRNVLERRSELAVLLAVGFRRRTVKGMVVREHGALLLAGLGVGIVAALLAVLPALLAPHGEFPYVSLAITLGAVLVSGAVWTWLAASLALRGRLLDALRNE
jgi:ABC-type antimicrobial peptide transport system permease subunit